MTGSITRPPNDLHGPDPTWSFWSSETVTKHDSTNFTKGLCRGIYVGGAGDVNVVYSDDTTQIFYSVPAGAILPGFIKRVNSTSTSASNMVALY